MSDEFKVISTQEEFDAAIKSRLEREKNKFMDQLAGMDDLKAQLEAANKQNGELGAALKEAQDKISGFDSLIAEKDKQLKNYEIGSVKTKVANELNLGYEAVNFLQGEDEESIRKSAEALKNLVGAKTPPLASGEKLPSADNSEAGLKQLLRNLKDEE